jgi:hypothetical protein
MRVAVILVATMMIGASAMAAPLSAKLTGEGVAVSIGDDLFTVYKNDEDLKKPYFWPVNGPASGKSVTVESTEPYPHHNSIFFGCDKVNGGNYWQDTNRRGQIVSQGIEIVEADGDRVQFLDTCLWQQPKKDPVIRDVRRVTVSAPSDDLRIIDFAITMEALVDIRIEKTNHSLFSARMMPELSVQSGGTLVNAEGESAEEGTFGKASPWCDYSGERDGVTEGLAILQHPDNRWYPSPWFTRNYGFFSPTPMYWLEGDRFELPKGETLTLQYRVLVHTGTAEDAAIAQHFEAYGE